MCWPQLTVFMGAAVVVVVAVAVAVVGVVEIVGIVDIVVVVTVVVVSVIFSPCLFMKFLVEMKSKMPKTMTASTKSALQRKRRSRIVFISLVRLD